MKGTPKSRNTDLSGNPAGEDSCSGRNSDSARSSRGLTAGSGPDVSWLSPSSSLFCSGRKSLSMCLFIFVSRSSSFSPTLLTPSSFSTMFVSFSAVSKVSICWILSESKTTTLFCEVWWTIIISSSLSVSSQLSGLLKEIFLSLIKLSDGFKTVCLFTGVRALATNDEVVSGSEVTLL